MYKNSTLSEVARATRAKPRTLQFWTSNGVIRPEASTLHGGPGTHRRYPRKEVEIAAVLAELEPLKLQIGTLKSFADYLREVLSAGDEFGFEDAAAVQAAINADRVRALPVKLRELHSKAYGLSKVPKGKPRFSSDERLRLMTWIAFENARLDKATTFIFFRVKPDGKWESEVGEVEAPDRPSEQEPMDILPLSWSSFIVIDVGWALSRIRD